MFFQHAQRSVFSSFVLLLLLLLGCTVEHSVTAFSISTKPITPHSFRFQRSSHTISTKGRHGICSNTKPTTTTTLSSAAVMAFGDGIFFTKVWKVTSPLLQTFREELGNFTLIQRAILVTVFWMGCQVGKTRPFWKRLTNVMDIPSSHFGPKAPILRGRAVSITDGDTIRFLHVPTWFHPTNIRKSKKEKASNIALPIRLCTYDTPETAKFGKPGQPFGDEAKNHLKDLLGSSASSSSSSSSSSSGVIQVRLLQKDQYGRAVAQVFTGRWPFRRYMDEQMLQAGLAEVYQGMGAVYGPKGKEEYLRMEEQARDSKLGIWSQKKRESAAEYKRRTK